MGLTHADVASVNQGFRDISDTLMKRRMMDEAAGERAADRELRGRALNQQAQQQQASDDWRKQMLENQQTQAAIKQLQDAYDQIAQDYSKGVIEKNEANRRAKAIVENIRQGTDIVLKNSPFARMLDSEGDLFGDRPADPGTTGMQNAGAYERYMQEADALDAGGDKAGAERKRQAARLLNANATAPDKPLVGSETTTEKTITNEGDERTVTLKQPFKIGAEPAKPASGARIRVISPKGKGGSIPAEQWPTAEKKGFKKAK